MIHVRHYCPVRQASFDVTSVGRNAEDTLQSHSRQKTQVRLPLDNGTDTKREAPMGTRKQGERKQEGSRGSVGGIVICFTYKI